MALYELHPFTNCNDLIAQLKTFAEANGWTIDTYSVGTNNRLHLHKGAAHFDMQRTTDLNLSLYGCTGYDSGAAYTAQPGTSAVKNFPFAAGCSYYFVSTLTTIYIHRIDTMYSFVGCFGAVADKVGGWTGGICAKGIHPSYAGFFFNASLYGSGGGYGQLYINGAWTSTAGAAGGLMGNAGSTILQSKQPIDYNAAILPLPISLFVGLATDGTKFQPVGFLPGLFICNGLSLYDTAAEITIGADTYLILPGGATIGNTTYHDGLYKLGA